MRGIISIIINIFNHLLVCIHVPRSLCDKMPPQLLRECAADRNLCWFCGFILEDIGTVKMDPKFIYLRPRFVDKFHSARVSSSPHHNQQRRDEKTCCRWHRRQHMHTNHHRWRVGRNQGNSMETLATLACSYTSHTTVRSTCHAGVGSPSITFPQFHTTIISCVVANVSNSAHRCSVNYFMWKEIGKFRPFLVEICCASFSETDKETFPKRANL